MQDGAPPLLSKSVRRFLEQHFGDRIISRHFHFPWPPRSPDHVPMDFWFCGYMKFRVYICNAQTLPELKDSIKPEIANIPDTIVCSSLLFTISRMQCVIACDGTHVGNVWSKNAFVRYVLSLATDVLSLSYAVHLRLTWNTVLCMCLARTFLGI